MGDAGMWCEIERHFTLNAALADIEMYAKRFPEERRKRSSNEPSRKNYGVTLEVAIMN